MRRRAFISLLGGTAAGRRQRLPFTRCTVAAKFLRRPLRRSTRPFGSMENRGLLLPWSRWACNARSWAMLPFASVWKRVCLKNKHPCSFCGTMAFYQERFIPWLIDLSMRQRMLAPYRERVVSSARGRVLEVGIGSGLNLPFYASVATEIIGRDPSPKLLEMANKAARKAPIPLRLIEGTAEAIPIEDHDVRCCRDGMDNVQHPR